MKSKTIILSSENQKGRGILTLFEENGLLQCRIRLYNIPKLSRFCKIGIYHNKKVTSANILEKNGVYTSSLVGDFDIDQDFYTAILDTQNKNEVVLSGGTYAGFFFNDQSVFDEEFSTDKENFLPGKFNESFETIEPNSSVFSSLEKENPNTDLYDYGNENNISLDEADKNKENVESSAVETLPDQNNSCCNSEDKCKTCKYKEYFYSQSNFSAANQNNGSVMLSEVETSPNQNNNPHDCNNNHNNKEDDKRSSVDLSTAVQDYNPNVMLSGVETSPEHTDSQNGEHDDNSDYSGKDNVENKAIIDALIPQFKYVFENYPEDETLTNLLPNSKFVKICENNEQYSIGAIYQDDEMKYICYAVMCDYNNPAPQELGEHYQWLPIDKEDPLSEGYYIVFQDANDLKIVKL